MPAPKLDPAVLLRAVEALKAHEGSVAAAARSLGLNPNTYRSQLKVASERGIDQVPAAARPPEGFIVTSHTRTLDEDEKVVRQSVRTERAPGEAYAPPKGLDLMGESAFVDRDHRLIGKWILSRRKGGSLEKLAAALEERFAAVKGKAPVTPAPAQTMADRLTVYPLADLHLGMMAWGRETGQDYDVKIAKTRTRRMLGELVAETPASRSAVLLILGDYFHMNDRTNMTPKSKHVLDVDGRWAMVYEVGADLAVTKALLLGEKHEEVEIVVVPGNHDPDAAITLMVALRLYFCDHPRISVNRLAGEIWFRRFGRCLFGAAHGHRMGPERMAMSLAERRPRDWAVAPFRHFFYGHIHHERVREVGSVRVESFNTIAGKDAHAAGAGYHSGQALNALTFDAERGLRQRHIVHLDPEAADEAASEA